MGFSLSKYFLAILSVKTIERGLAKASLGSPSARGKSNNSKKPESAKNSLDSLNSFLLSMVDSSRVGAGKLKTRTAFSISEG